MKKILHIVNQSPFSHQALRQCLICYKPSDSILFIGDGVYSTLDTHQYARVLQVMDRCYALRDDIVSRGLTSQKTLNNVTFIDDFEFVNLSVEYPLSQSWF